jgi:hypothetical protein
VKLLVGGLVVAAPGGVWEDLLLAVATLSWLVGLASVGGRRGGGSERGHWLREGGKGSGNGRMQMDLN